MSYLRRDQNQQRGAAAEKLALDHLQAAGLTLLARNYRCRLGEIDLIMQDGDTTVFIEVRLRSRGAHGAPLVSAAESIDAHKQSRIAAAAHHYLMGKSDMPCRFDCILLNRVTPERVEWLRNAFTL